MPVVAGIRYFMDNKTKDINIYLLPYTLIIPSNIDTKYDTMYNINRRSINVKMG